MSVIQLEPSSVRGLSFGVADLILIRSWAAAQGLEMRVHLDYVAGQQTYDEVLAFHVGNSSLFDFLMWRDRKSVYVKPVMGWPRRYGSVVAALSGICPEAREVVRDIEARFWPR